jgi:V8-like Glu-specific endopeptidase
LSYEANDDSYPATAVTFIVSRWGSKYASGTGFLVGKNDVLTAAHVVYNGTLGGLADEIRIYPSYDPDASDNRVFRPVWIQYYKDFDPNLDGLIQLGDFYRPTFAGSEIDIALLALNQDIGSIFGFFGIDPNFRGGSVNVIGYPGIYGQQPTFDTGSVARSSVDNVYLINSDLEVNPGNSGGPIYYDSGNGPFAIGIVSTRAGATSMASHYSWLADSILENDRFLSGNSLAPTYTLLSSQTSVDEGDTAVFTLRTTNVVPFTNLSYRITGVQSGDISNGALEGSVVVGRDGAGTISLSLRKDLLTEGDETLNVTVGGTTASVIVRDTSKTIQLPNGDSYTGDIKNGQYVSGAYVFASGHKYIGEFKNDTYEGQGTLFFSDGTIWRGQWQAGKLLPSSYLLRTQSNSVTEGVAVQFDLEVTNFKSGEVVLYSIIGIQAQDVASNQLSGSAVVNTQGRASIFFFVLADNVTEGSETLTITLRSIQGVNLAVTNLTIIDTSRSLIPSETPGVSGTAPASGTSSNATTPVTGKSTIPITGVVEAATVYGSDFKDSVSGADTVSQTIYLFGGDDWIGKASSSTSNDTLYGGEGNDYLAPGAGKNFVYGGDGNDKLIGWYGQNFLYGEQGDDFFSLDSSPTGWDDTVDGGAGMDTVEFLSLHSAWVSIQRTAAGQTKLVHAANSLTLENIERLRFVDKAIGFDTATNAGQAYRLYKAAFNRDPQSGDKKGLGYWIKQLDDGTTPLDVANRFIDSNEFRTLYGTNPTNEQFLTKLYQNVLGRQPEATGYNWWLNELNTNPQKTKAKVLADFAESSENQTGVINLIGNGITYEPWVG